MACTNFGGIERLNVDNNNANFYMSQSRIRVEMSFGMMSNRFGLLCSPLHISLHHLGPLIQTVAWLHNYMLTENNDYSEYLTEERQGFTQTREDEVGMETNGDPAQAIPGVSLRREEIVRRVQLQDFHVHL